MGWVIAHFSLSRSVFGTNPVRALKAGVVKIAKFILYLERLGREGRLPLLFANGVPPVFAASDVNGAHELLRVGSPA